jgi:hypothetical protein
VAMAEAPEQEASARVAQTLAVAVQVAEVAIRLRAQRTERAAAGQAQQAGAVRTDRLARHAAARVQWSRALDPDWLAGAELAELGRAWGAAAGWADTDPTAEVAAARVEARMAQTAPTAMDRFHQLRAAGSTRVEAMRAVLADVAAEASSRARVFVAEPGQAPTPGATRNASAPPAAAPGGPDPAGADRRSQVVRSDGPAGADSPATARQVHYITDLLARSSRPDAGGPTDPAAIARLSRAEASVYIESLGGGTRGGGTSPWRTAAAGNPHAGDVAAESHPRPYVDVGSASPPAVADVPPAASAQGQTRTVSR